MSRRIGVPAVTDLATVPESERVNPLLAPREVAPVYDRKLQPLAGVRWPRGEPRAQEPWEVALFDVPDPGELQTW